VRHKNSFTRIAEVIDSGGRRHKSQLKGELEEEIHGWEAKSFIPSQILPTKLLVRGDR